jgi:uncharacterized membrane protein
MVSLFTLSTVAEISQYTSIHPTGSLTDSEIDGEISHWHKFIAGLYFAERDKQKRPEAKREARRLLYCGGVLAFLAFPGLLAALPVGGALATASAGFFVYAGIIVRKREDRKENTLYDLLDVVHERIVALESEQQKRAFKDWSLK